MAQKKSIWKITGIAVIGVIILLAVAKSAGWLGNSNALKVSTDKVVKRDIEETVSANGKVQPEVELKISADVSGEIVDLFVKEGDMVKKGTLLCRINPEIYASNLDRTNAAVSGAKSNLESSKSRLLQSQSEYRKTELNYNRNKKLFDEGVISAADFDVIKAAYEVAKAEVDASQQSISAAAFNVQSAEASLKESRENLNKTNIYAPVDGTVSKLSKEKGERVVGTNMMEGTEIMRLANLNEMEVSVDVSENDIVKVVIGDTASIDIDAYIGRKFAGVVTEVANSANSTTAVSTTDQVTNFTVKIRISRDSYKDLLEGKPESYSPFRPGMSASVDVRTKHEANILALPIQAVTTRDTMKKAIVEKPGTSATTSDIKTSIVPAQECVFVLENGKAKLRTVKTGIQDNVWIQVKEGLKEGDVVISAPYNAVSKTLKDGSEVKVVDKEELFAKDKGK